MYDKNNIFAKILRSEIPCNKVYEDEGVLFFYDINPIAKIHVLGIPKVECVDFEDFISNSNEKNVYSFFKKVNKVINLLGINKLGYRLITNSGKDGGQEIPHFHVHIIGGEKLGTKIK
ncbi:MAG: histidine triad nucleotide-binding protein [Pelagibacteraceae bacterium]|nr:histidine triad nucleotide-binding protein [Pelagibacteraceae bacterium]|tara:strand:- start:33398 stop:33751 length:354 start_codon:yes stop_codon:yes gene_type:complete